jgi:hypothetical protein
MSNLTDHLKEQDEITAEWEAKSEPRVIDITPTWAGLVPAFVALNETGTDEGRATAITEIRRMAQAADAHNATASTAPADLLALAMMNMRPDLRQMSLDEWLVEHDAKLTPAEKTAGHAISALYDAEV